MKFIDKTLDDIIQISRRDIFLSISANKNKFLNKINPNIKITAFFLILISLNIFINLKFYIILSILLLFFIYFLNSSFKNFILILISFNFLGLAIIFLPLLLNLDNSFNLTLNYNNIDLFFTNVLRSQTCMLLLLFLGMTTGWSKLIRALKIFKFPDFIIELLLLNYLYIFYFLNILIDINYSLKNRLIRKVSLTSIYKFISFKIALLFQKSMYTAKQVNLAMISRSCNVRKF